MELLILGSLFLFGGLMSLGGLFDGGDDGDPEPNPDEATSGNDTLGGDTGIVAGLGGDDAITVSGDAKGYGGRGKDIVTASDDATAYGGLGDDQGFANSGGTFYGGLGDDDVTASDGKGYGNAGNDALVGDNYQTSLFGGSGDDTFNLIEDANGYGDAGDDTLSANSGATAWGGLGNDSLTGDATLYGEDGDDVLAYASVFGPSGDAVFGAAYGGIGNDSLSGQGTLNGDDGNDSLSGDAALFGGLGDDFIRSSSEADHSSYGGEGNDTVLGSDLLYGDGGDDSLRGWDKVFGGAGNDVMVIDDFGGEFEGVGTADGGDGDDTITAADPGDFSAGALAGGAGDDVIRFYSGKDVIGGAGEDVLIAQRSAENGLASTITLGNGADLLALDPNEAGGFGFEYGNGYGTTLVSDFNPAQDQIGIIVPQTAASIVSVSITPNVAGGYTDVTLTLPGQDTGNADGLSRQTYRLQGVTDFDASDVLLFANQAAAQARTSYGTL